MRERNVTKGLTMVYAERLANQLVSFAVTLVLARLLLPSDYGTVAIVTVFVNIADAFVTSGLGNALIQKKEVGKEDYSTILVASIALSLALYACLFLLSEPIAAFYDNQLLVFLIRVLALKLPIASITTVQLAYISRNMQFGKQVVSTICACIISAALGIVMAIRGFGAWALVAQVLVNAVVSATVLGILINKCPGLKFSKEKFSSMISYGWKLTLTAVIDRGYNEIRSLVIGKRFSSAELAYYTKGKALPNTIMYSVDSAMTRVLFPVFSAIQDRKNELRERVSKTVSLSTYLIMPMLVLFIFTADEIVSIILTDKWLSSVEYIRVFCVYYMITPIKSAKYQAIKSIGRSDISLKCELLQKAIDLIVMLYTILVVKTVSAIAYGNIIVTLCAAVITGYTCKKYIGISYKNQLSDIMPSCFVTFAMTVPLLLIECITMNQWCRLLIQLSVGIIVYVLASKLLKFRQYSDIIRILKSLFTKVHVAKVSKK